jgi:hypothetical protein
MSKETATPEVYLDDVSLSADSLEQLLKSTEKLFSKVKEQGLTLKPSKVKVPQKKDREEPSTSDSESESDTDSESDSPPLEAAAGAAPHTTAGAVARK